MYFQPHFFYRNQFENLYMRPQSVWLALTLDIMPPLHGWRRLPCLFSPIVCTFVGRCKLAAGRAGPWCLSPILPFFVPYPLLTLRFSSLLASPFLLRSVPVSIVRSTITERSTTLYAGCYSTYLVQLSSTLFAGHYYF